MHVAASQDFERIAIYSGDALEMLVRNPFLSSAFGHTGQAHSLAAALPPGEINRIVAQRILAVAAEGKVRLERKSGLGGGPRLLRLTEQRQHFRKMKMRQRKIAVGLDASA
jgi:hypothetical protein